MKKLFSVIVISLVVLGLVPQAFAAGHISNHVALHATTMGGQHVAECAQSHERGVSECARMEHHME